MQLVLRRHYAFNSVFLSLYENRFKTIWKSKSLVAESTFLWTALRSFGNLKSLQETMTAWELRSETLKSTSKSTCWVYGQRAGVEWWKLCRSLVLFQHLMDPFSVCGIGKILDCYEPSAFVTILQFNTLGLWTDGPVREFNWTLFSGPCPGSPSHVSLPAGSGCVRVSSACCTCG